MYSKCGKRNYIIYVYIFIGKYYSLYTAYMRGQQMQKVSN